MEAQCSSFCYHGRRRHLGDIATLATCQQSFKGLRESLLRLQLAPHALNQPDIAGALQAMTGLHALSTAFEAVAVDEPVGGPVHDLAPVAERA